MTKWVICPVCDGEGKHSLAIDGQGLTAEDFDEWDVDEIEAYHRGDLDRTCEMCRGRGSIPAGQEDEARRQLRRWSMSDAELLSRDDY